MTKRTDEERAAYNARVRGLSTPEAHAEVMKRAAENVARERERRRVEGLTDERGDLTELGRAKVEAALKAAQGTASGSFTGC